MSESDRSTHRSMVPLWLKLTWTIFTLMLVPVYTWEYGLANFLWFSNIALLAMNAALWLGGRLLAGMMALAVVLPETVWIIDFAIALVAGSQGLVGLADYMFDEQIPLLVRVLSLYHIPLPLMLLWLVWRWGYDGRALYWQTALAWVLLPASRLLGDPDDNINWTYGWGDQPQTLLPPWAYLIMLMVVFPLLIYLPTHLLLKWLDRRRPAQAPA